MSDPPFMSNHLKNFGELDYPRPRKQTHFLKKQDFFPTMK